MTHKDEISAAKYIGSNIYRKSNALILSRSTPSLITNKLLMICTLRAEKKKDGSLVAQIPGNCLKQMFNSRSNSFYDRVKDSCYSKDTSDNGTLMDYRAIFEDDENHRFSAHTLVTDAEFQNGVLSVTFNPKMEKYITGMKNNYTSLDTSEMMSLNSIYSWRLLELFRKDATIQKWLAEKEGKEFKEPCVVEYDLINLKLMLGIIDGSNPKVFKALKEFDRDQIESYDQSSMRYFNNFKNNVLECARKELQEKTTIRFEYQLVRSGLGGKTSAIQFYVYKNQPERDEEPEEEMVGFYVDDLIDELRDLIEEKLPTKDLRRIAMAADGDYIRIKKAYRVAKESKREIRNLTGFLLDAIKKNYSTPVKKHSADSFMGFKQNGTDYNALFDT